VVTRKETGLSNQGDRKAEGGGRCPMEKHEDNASTKRRICALVTCEIREELSGGGTIFTRKIGGA